MKKSIVITLLIIIFSGIAKNSHSQQFEEWYLYTSDKLNLYINEFGTGDTVIVLHGGFGAEHSYLLDAVKPLQDKFHFVLFDQRGSLRSPAADSLLSFDKILSDIESIRVAFGLKKITLLAHSMGTRIAMAYAEKFPKNIKNLVLVSSYLPVSSNTELRNYATFYLENRPAVEQERQKAKLLQDKKNWTDKMYTYNWRISFASTNIYTVSNWPTIKGGVAFFNQRTAQIVYPTAPTNWNYITTFKKTTFPVTVINGDYDYLNFTAISLQELLNFYNSKMANSSSAAVNENDDSFKKLVLQKQWKDFEKDLPTLKVHIIKNAGHRIWCDQKLKFKKDLLVALKRN